MRILVVVGIGGFLLAASPSEGAWRNLLKKGAPVAATTQPAGVLAQESTGIEVPAALPVASVAGEGSAVGKGDVAEALEAPAGGQDSIAPGGPAAMAESASPIPDMQANSAPEASIEETVAQSAVSPVREGAAVAELPAQTVHRDEESALKEPTAPKETPPVEAALAAPSQVEVPSLASNSGHSLESAAAAVPPQDAERLTMDHTAAYDAPQNPVEVPEDDPGARVPKATPSAELGPSILASRSEPPVQANLDRLPIQTSGSTRSPARPRTFEGKVVRVEGAYVTCSISESSKLQVGMIVGIWNGSKQAARAQVLSRRTGFVDLEITEDFGRERASVGALLRLPR